MEVTLLSTVSASLLSSSVLLRTFNPAHFILYNGSYSLTELYEFSRATPDSCRLALHDRSFRIRKLSGGD